MNPNPPKNSNSALCGTFIVLGVLCMLGTILAAFALKDGIIGRVGEPPRVDMLSDGFEIEQIDREIEFKESAIRVAKDMPDWDELRKKREEFEKLSNKNSKAAETPSTVGESKAEKIKRLEDEKQQLIAKKNDLIGKQRAKEMKPRTWSELSDDYSLDLLIPGVLPLGLFSLYLGALVFGGRLPARNPLSLTDFERRCLLFLPFSIVFSAFGFFVFVWILSIIY